MESRNKNKDLALIYSCSGCSSVAQLANQVAFSLSCEGVAEMSCIAGVGGGVPSLVKKAKSKRRIIALDGCHLTCVKKCLSKENVVPSAHYILTDFGLKKKQNCKFDSNDVVFVKEKIINKEVQNEI